MQGAVRCAGLGIVGLLVAGCYSLEPVTGAVPDVGRRVAFDVNDAGRMALGGSMGPEIAQVEGLLVDKDNGGYLLSVSSVRLLRGGEQVWAGEQVRLSTEHVGHAYERRFSATRSILMGAAGLGGLTAFLVSRSLIAGGQESEDPPDCREDCEPVDRRGRP